MKTSVVNPQYQFDQDNWLVSLLSLEQRGGGACQAGHACIVVEGEETDGELFVGAYDIHAKTFETSQLSFIERMQSFFGNVQGVISAINVREGNKYINIPSFDARQQYRESLSQTWSVVPEHVFRMIDHIKAQKKILETARAQKQYPFRFQAFGRYSLFGLFNTRQGEGPADNCITWAENQLVIAGVGSSMLLKALDSSAAVPGVHAGSSYSARGW